jgi:hypothetical protein
MHGPELISIVGMSIVHVASIDTTTLEATVPVLQMQFPQQIALTSVIFRLFPGSFGFEFHSCGQPLQSGKVAAQIVSNCGEPVLSPVNGAT